jgi:hypothetical protein
MRRKIVKKVVLVVAILAMVVRASGLAIAQNHRKIPLRLKLLPRMLRATKPRAPLLIPLSLQTTRLASPAAWICFG